VDGYLTRTQDVDITEFKTFIGPALEVLVKNCRNIRRINVADCNWLEDKLLKPLLCTSKYLRYVN
jgi:hypothetical protein